MYKWNFEIAFGYDPILEDLRHHLGKDSNESHIRYVEENHGNYYDFRSELLETIEDPSDAALAASQLLSLINGQPLLASVRLCLHQQFNIM